MMERTNTPQKIVFLTGSLSLIKTLISNNDKELNQLYSNLSDLNHTNTVVIQWVPSHCKLHGNEEADSLAKTGSRETQIDRSTSYKEEKSLIKKHQQNQWNANHPCHNKADPYHKLNRKEQVIIFRLRTGHNRLQYHLFNKFKVGETDLCSCTTDSQTVEHILQSCPLYEELRHRHWPEPDQATVAQKLFGSLEDLRRTTAFVEDSRLVI